MSIEKIAEEINYAQNDLIRNIFMYNTNYEDIPTLLHNKYGQMSYSQLLENFPYMTFVNLEPNLHYSSYDEHYIHVPIRNLYD